MNFSELLSDKLLNKRSLKTNFLLTSLSSFSLLYPYFIPTNHLTPLKLLPKPSKHISSWSSYFPFSIFANNPDENGAEMTTNHLLFQSSNSDQTSNLAAQFGDATGFGTSFDSSPSWDAYSHESNNNRNYIDFLRVQEALNEIRGIDPSLKQLLLSLLRSLIIIINSILGEYFPFSLTSLFLFLLLCQK